MFEGHELFDRVRDCINNRESGKLHAAIRCLLGPKNELGDKIQQHFGIRPDARLDDDLKLLQKNAMNMKKDPAVNRTFELFMGALALIALCYLWDSSSRRRGSLTGSGTTLDKVAGSEPEPPRIKTLSICLVMPLAKVGSIAGVDPLPAAEVERLVDGANFFRCVEKREAEEDENLLLHLSDAAPDRAANPNIYLRLDFSGGEELLEANTQYALKRRLTGAEPATVGRQAMLDSLEGLKKFNRI